MIKDTYNGKQFKVTIGDDSGILKEYYHDTYTRAFNTFRHFDKGIQKGLAKDFPFTFKNIAHSQTSEGYAFITIVSL